MNNMKTLASAFSETQRMLQQDEALYKRTVRAIQSTFVYPEKMEITRVLGSCYTKTDVKCCTTLQEARRLSALYYKVAVLNFANAVTPGGGVAYGEDSQEAMLCRCTNLYPCLTKSENLIHYYEHNDSLAPYYSSRIMYTEQVTVFKDEEEKLLPCQQWYSVDVISGSALNLRDQNVTISKKKLKKLLYDRIKNILMVAEYHGVQALVLGAFGCGGYGISAKTVAEIFYSLLGEGEFSCSFREVSFAITVKSKKERAVFQEFQDKFSFEEPNPLFGKNVSIYGDSISTFQGYNPRECKVYYDAMNTGKLGVFSVNSTWWMLVLQQLGGRLLQNISWSGSRVYGTTKSAGVSEWRLHSLEKDGVQPDAILIYMGMNDYGYGIPPGDKYFFSAYGYMLGRMKSLYPEAQIFCATLCSGSVRGQAVFPEIIKGNAFADYNDAIRKNAELYSCKLIDLEAAGVLYDTLDGCHPTAMGMQQLAAAWIQAIEETENPVLEQGKMSRNIGVLIVLIGGAILLVALLIFLIIMML